MKGRTLIPATSLAFSSEKTGGNKNFLLHAMMELNWEDVKKKSPHIIADMIKQKLDELGFYIAEK